MTNKKILMAVLIPFLLLCLLIFRAEFHISQGKEWKFQVQGYDPRDLLRGHYLRFNLRYNWVEGISQCENANDCCLCLSEIGEIAPTVQKTSCEVAQNQCDGFIRGEFERSLNRYYIPENYAAQAEQILRDARVGNDAFLSVSINSQGEPLITDMIIRGESLNELIKQLPEE